MAPEESQSILNFFGFQEQPFAATADPGYFYATRGHKECLFRLWSNVDERHGIAVILGHYGTGKTTLLRKLLTGIRARPEKYNTAVIGSPIPSWTSFSLLESIVTQFGVQADTRSFAAYMEALNRYLLANRDRINTLIIDDSQNLNKRGQLELLRLVQNLETQQHKLLNLVLFAQLEWMEVLRAAPNFEQRVNMTYTLGSLSVDETRELIEFRLRQAGSGNRVPVFEEQAIRAIHAYAEGSPRVTVTLCRNALLLAAHIKTRRIGQAIILHTIQKTTLPDNEKRARVASVLNPGGPQPSPAPARASAQPQEPPATQGERRDVKGQRANNLLLRAAKMDGPQAMPVNHPEETNSG
jgi:general secretion pathway protein A